MAYVIWTQVLVSAAAGMRPSVGSLKLLSLRFGDTA